MYNKTNKGGRPPKENHDRKSHQVSTRLNEKENALLLQKSRSLGVVPAVYIREAILNSRIVERISPEQMNIYKSLQKDAREIGRNVREASRSYNGCYTIAKREKFQESLQSFRNLIDIYKRILTKK